MQTAFQSPRYMVNITKDSQNFLAASVDTVSEVDAMLAEETEKGHLCGGTVIIWDTVTDAKTESVLPDNPALMVQRVASKIQTTQNRHYSQMLNEALESRMMVCGGCTSTAQRDEVRKLRDAADLVTGLAAFDTEMALRDAADLRVLELLNDHCKAKCTAFYPVGV